MIGEEEVRTERSLPTPEAPVYSKFRHGNCQHTESNPTIPTGTQFWGIQVNEGWRSWILCCDMYEWAADELLKRLREANGPWTHG